MTEFQIKDRNHGYGVTLEQFKEEIAEELTATITQVIFYYPAVMNRRMNGD